MQIYSSLFNFHNNSNVSFKAKPIPPKVARKMELKMLRADSIDIFCHSSPDEDTFNSANVLAKWLISKGKKVRLIVEGKLKGIYVNDSDRQIICDPNKLKDFNKRDLAVVVDCNSKLRISENARKLLNRYKKKQILGFDHHESAKKQDLIGNINLNSKNPFYIDKKARSCSAIIYRFFECLGVKLDQDSLGALYCGMLDDLSKSGCVKIVKTDNDNLVAKSSMSDKYTVEILKNIEETLLPGKLKEVVGHLDILSNLNPAEESFQNRLFSKEINFVEKPKLAYAEIPFDDGEWINLGQDNIVTSKILSNFRQILLNNPDNEMIPPDIRPKLKNIDGIVVFYRGTEVDVPSQETYKFSMHSRSGYALELVNKLNIEIPTLNGGGHPDRVGGKIYSTDPEECKNFVKTFKEVAKGKLPLN